MRQLIDLKRIFTSFHYFLKDLSSKTKIWLQSILKSILKYKTQILFLLNGLIFFLIGIFSARKDWVNEIITWIGESATKLTFADYAVAIAFIALIFQVRQFTKDSNSKFIETLDKWLIEFQNLISEKRLHENWGTFAINMIDQADRICYFALRGLIRYDLIEFFKDQITSAYAIGFRDILKHISQILMSNKLGKMQKVLKFGVRKLIGNMEMSYYPSIR